MQQTLIHKLHEYIRENNPDLLLQLNEGIQVSKSLTPQLNNVRTLINHLENNDPEYIIEDTCLTVLTLELRPSKFNYIRDILKEKFPASYNEFQASGILKFEIINLIMHCQSVFEDLNFSAENQGNQFIRCAITGSIRYYLESLTAAQESINKRKRKI